MGLCADSLAGALTGSLGGARLTHRPPALVGRNWAFTSGAMAHREGGGAAEGDALREPFLWEEAPWPCGDPGAHGSASSWPDPGKDTHPLSACFLVTRWGWESTRCPLRTEDAFSCEQGTPSEVVPLFLHGVPLLPSGSRCHSQTFHGAEGPAPHPLLPPGVVCTFVRASAEPTKM